MVGGRPRFLLPTILLWVALLAAGQSFDGPARAMSQKIAAALKTREPVALGFSNVATVNPPDAMAAQQALERELHGLAVITAPPAAITVALTLSENLRGFVWVAEIRRGDTQEVVMEDWPKLPEVARAGSVVIEKRRMLDEPLRILDCAPLGHGLLVLDAEAVSVYENAERKLSIRLPISRPLPRDLRGRLLVQGDVYQAYLPGLTCNGSAASGLSITCRDEGLWPLGPNAYGILNPTRNFFDERLVLADGLSRRMPPFLAAARFAANGHDAWVFSAMDGHTHLYYYNAAFVPVASWIGWGSDIAAIESDCGSRTLLLATGTGDSTAPDSVQAFELTDSTQRSVADPVSLPGPVTALWPASERGTALAVSRDLKSGRYAAFRLAIACSR
jgi:hypothetical protein